MRSTAFRWTRSAGRRASSTPDMEIGAIVIDGGERAFATKAMDLCLSARVLDGDEADRYGPVSRFVVDERLLEEILALATRIDGFSLPALVAIKASVNRAHETALAEGIREAQRALDAQLDSEDAHGGMRAFLERRRLRFAHR